MSQRGTEKYQVTVFDHQLFECETQCLGMCIVVQYSGVSLFQRLTKDLQATCRENTLQHIINSMSENGSRMKESYKIMLMWIGFRIIRTS